MAVANPLAVTAPGKRPVKTALHQAVLDSRLHQVRLLVSRHGVNVDSKDVFGRTPLMLACLLDNEDYGYKMVRIFMRAGAFMNIKDTMNRTALSYACMKGREGIVARFLKEDVLEINAQDNDGNTPLNHGALSGNPVVVKMLLDVLVRFGLPMDIRNALGYTALLLACKYGHYVSAHMILTEGNASPTLRDNEFFMNASEWIHSTPNQHNPLQESFIQQRSRTLPSIHMHGFMREHSLYENNFTPVCHHVKTPIHPLRRSVDSALGLPSIFRHLPEDTRREVILDGMDARQLLLKAIDDIVHNPRFRPLSTMSSVFTRSSYPSTPKLLAQTRRSHTMMVPDMRTLFAIYSDQCSGQIEKPERQFSFGGTTGNKKGHVVIREPAIAVESFGSPTKQVLEPVIETSSS